MFSVGVRAQVAKPEPLVSEEVSKLGQFSFPSLIIKNALCAHALLCGLTGHRWGHQVLKGFYSQLSHRLSLWPQRSWGRFRPRAPRCTIKTFTQNSNSSTFDHALMKQIWVQPHNHLAQFPELSRDYFLTSLPARFAFPSFLLLHILSLPTPIFYNVCLSHIDSANQVTARMTMV